MSRLYEALTARAAYPDHPGVKAAGTSEQAAASIAGVSGTLRDKVKQIIAASPGLTADEIAARLDKSPLSIRPRVSELRRLGEISHAPGRGTNDSGMTANRWVIAPPLAEEGGHRE